MSQTEGLATRVANAAPRPSSLPSRPRGLTGSVEGVVAWGRRRHVAEVLGLAVASFLLFFAALGERDLWNPNEPLYGQAVAEMDSRGDWVLPTANGEVFAEKPILYFWLARLSARALGGVNEFSLRFPSALAGMLGVLLIYYFTTPYVGRRQSLIIAGCLGTQYGYWFASRQIQMDVLLTVLVLATLVPLLHLWDHGTPALRAWLASGLAAGLGFLAKGPLAFLLPFLVMTGYSLLTRRKPPTPFLKPALLALSVSILVAAPWFLLLWWRHPEAVSEVLLRQNVTRYLQAWDHQQPWWYYLKYVWLELSPWSWIAPLAIGLWPRSRAEGRLLRLSLVWLVLLVVFFSMSDSKRAPYLLPAAPAVAILAGTVLHHWREGFLARIRNRAVGGAVVTILVVVISAGIAIIFEGPKHLPDAGGQLRAIGAVIAAAGLFASLGLFKGSRLATTPAAPLAVLYCCYLVVSIGVFPLANELKSARRFGLEIQRLSGDAEIACFRLWTHRAAHSFYGRTVVPHLTAKDELISFWEQPGERYVLVEDGVLGQAKDLLPSAVIVFEDPIGSRRAYLLGRARLGSSTSAAVSSATVSSATVSLTQ